MAVQPRPESAMPPPYAPRYIDIGINLADPIFRGRYHGKQRHPDDLDSVVGRAREVGCSKLIVTGSDFQSFRDALRLADDYPGTVYATVGIHPCSSAIFSASATARHDEHTVACEPDPSAPIAEDDLPDGDRSAKVMAALAALLEEARSSSPGRLVALGEFGLDYDRLHYCNKAVQLHSFEAQLKLAAELQPPLPLFLHSRAAHADFLSRLKASFGDGLERLERGAVVHSFTGTAEEADELMKLGLYIGINGCSFKTAENCAVVREIALDRIMLETDGPWCEVRPSHEGWKYLAEAGPASEPSEESEAQSTKHASRPTGGKQAKVGLESKDSRFKTVKKEKWQEGAMVKGRNEPCSIERVARIVAGIKGVRVEDVCEAAWRNTVAVFGLDEAR